MARIVVTCRRRSHTSDAASVGGRVCVLGGSAPGGPRLQSDALDPASNRTVRNRRLPRPLTDAAVVTAGSRIYVLGGIGREASTAESPRNGAGRSAMLGFGLQRASRREPIALCGGEPPAAPVGELTLRDRVEDGGLSARR
jgi:hypothetical protein